MHILFDAFVSCIMICTMLIAINYREHSGSVVECLTQDRRAAGSSLTRITALCP